MTSSTGPGRRRCGARHLQRSGGAPGLFGESQTGGRSETQENLDDLKGNSEEQ